jgi:2-methylisocitrate lyase-like PEP mutase family enzyme
MKRQMASQKDRLTQFRALHSKGEFLVLPNSWDAASARMAEEAGAKALASSSAAVAWCHGYPDGEGMPRDVVLTSVREIARVTTLPLTVDSEAGYSSNLREVAAHVMTLIDMGVAGINIEDGTEPASLLADKIRAIKLTAKEKGADIFINARSDVYLKNLVPDDKKLSEITARGILYRDAGSDGFFAPAVNDIAHIREIVAAVDLPLNILMMRATPPLGESGRCSARECRRVDRAGSLRLCRARGEDATR